MRLRRAAAVTIAASAMALVPAATAGARAHVTGFTAFDQRLLADMNSARASHGLPAVQLNNSLEAVAYNWSQRMAAAGHAHDNPRLRATMDAACPGWRHIGETVGVAGEADADQLFRVYMRDSAGRDTILSRKFAVVGVSTVTTDEDGSTQDWNTISFADQCSR